VDCCRVFSELGMPYGELMRSVRVVGATFIDNIHYCIESRGTSRLKDV
jgi:hypothetical protein